MPKYVLGLMLIILLVSGVVVAQTDSLLPNGGFEEVKEIKAGGKKLGDPINMAEGDHLMPMPSSHIPWWGFWAQRGVHGEKYLGKIDQEVKHSGKYSITLKNMDPLHTGSGACFTIQRISITPGKYILSGWVKGEETTEIIVDWALCFIKESNKKPFYEKEFIGEGTFDWKEFQVSIDASEARLETKVVEIIIYLRNAGEGQVWFDDISLVKKEEK